VKWPRGTYSHKININKILKKNIESFNSTHKENKPFLGLKLVKKSDEVEKAQNLFVVLSSLRLMLQGREITVPKGISYLELSFERLY